VSTIVVDTSAMVAILTNEPGDGWLAAPLAHAGERLISAPTALELGVVLEARSPAPGILRRTLRDAEITVTPFDDAMAQRALDAWSRFGKGRHPAGLNFGDCCSYAVAEATGCPVLCVGNDFSQTDLAVLRPPKAEAANLNMPANPGA
jgi:ribonuclease VapC